MSKHIAFISNSGYTAYLFRKSLFTKLIELGNRVCLYVPDLDSITRLKLEELGVEIRTFQLTRSNKRPWLDLFHTIKLFFELKANSYDMVISTFLKPVVFGSFAAWLARVPFRVSFIEGMGFTYTDDGQPVKGAKKFLQQLTSWLLKLALNKNHKIFVLNQDDYQLLQSAFNIQSNRLVYLDGIGVNLNEFPYTPLTPGNLRFLFVGRLLKEKGIIEYLEACKKITQEFPYVECWVVGGIDDNPGAITQEQIGHYLDSSIQWLGVRDDVPELIKKSSVFVLPSYREGKPRSTMEAMAIGRSIITTDVPGCRETVVGGRNGVVVAPRDIDALFEAMKFLILNPALVAQQGYESYQLAKANYDSVKINNIILQELAL